MYRAYACGVGLPQRHNEMHWQKFLKESHHRRMREMKPAIDNKAPLKFPHLQENLKKRQMDEERYTWIERDNHHILDQLTRVTEATQSPQKDTEYKHRSMLADGQRKEFQRISADNSRLHRALNRIKPTVPSLKEVQIRAKDLERWYKNGCKLPDVLYDNVNANAPVIEKTLAAISPVRHAQRSLSHTECSADIETATNDCISHIPKQIKHTNKKEHASYASPKCVAAGRDFGCNKSLMGRLRPELLRDVCEVKQPSAALRQLLQAACSALGEPTHAASCIDCMSDQRTANRLSRFEAVTMDSTHADAFMAHMTGYVKIDTSGLQLNHGAKTAISTLQSWCLSLQQLLQVHQQELLSNQQPFERLKENRQRKERKNWQAQQSGRVVEGLHSDDDLSQDATISQLMRALPDKKHPSNQIQEYKDSNNRYEVNLAKQGEYDEFEEDIENLIEDGDTP